MFALHGVGILQFISYCLLASARSSVADGSYFTDNFLLVTELRSLNIYQVSLNGTSIRLPIRGFNPMGAVYDPNIQKIFWLNQMDGRVMSSYLNFTSKKIIKKARAPEGITIDPDEQFIFYADGGLRTINLASYDGKMHLQIVVNANHPRAIELDRMYKHVYWTDWGMETIEMVDYDGQNRKIVVTRPGSWMNGLAIDIEGRKMYWTDAKIDRLERADIDGSNVETLLRHNDTLSYKNGTAVIGQGEAHYFGVAVDENNIYFSDWMRKGIYQAPINMSGSAYEYRRFDSGDISRSVNGISMYKSSNYYTAPSSPCVNHRCSDLCVPLKSGYRCACPDMRRLDINNNHTCSTGLVANGPDLVWQEHDGYRTSYLRGAKGDPKEYLRMQHLRLWTWRSPSWKWTAVDINYRESLVYMYDSIDRYLVQVSLNGSMRMKLLNFGLSSQVNGLAYDWLSHNLYWTDSLYNWIAMMKPGTNYTRTLIETTLDKPHGIAVYPQKGLMFWTDWGVEEKIQQANLDGTDITALVTTELYKPMGITVDYAKNKIYWTNTQFIESFDLLSKVRVKFGRRSQNTFIDVTVYKNFMFATDQGFNVTTGRSKPQLWFFDFDSFDERGTRLPLLRKPYGIAMYAASRQVPDAAAPCSVHNCTHLCVPVPTSEGFIARCLCRDGYTTNDNGKTCKPMPTSQGAMYVYALEDRICAVPIKKMMKKNSKDIPDSYCFFNSTAKGYKFRAVNFNYREGEVYFTEYGTSVKTIRRARLEKKTVNSVLVYGTGDVRGLVVDWMTSNMYWTDADASAIWVSRLEGEYMRNLIPNINNPGAVELDMQMKRLFWTESLGKTSKIMVAKLDGTDPSTFVSINSDVENSTITSLAVDYLEESYTSLEHHLTNRTRYHLTAEVAVGRLEQIYWVDPSRNSIWSASLIDGSGRKMQSLVSRRGNIYGVAVMQDFIGFSEKSNSSSIHVAEKDSGKEMLPRGIAHYNRKAAYDIIAYYRGNQPLFLGNTSSSCDVANGGCKQLCFPMPTGHKCGCTDSMKVSRDGASCEPSLSPIKDKFFLIADDYRRQIYQADENLENTRALKFPQYDRPIGLTYDFVSDRVFWADYNTHVVKSMLLNGKNVKTLFGESRGSRTEGLAFDPVSQLLYYTDSGRDLVAVMNPSGKYHKILVMVESPRAIVLDPANGYIYVTSRTTGKGNIIRYTMDGKNGTVLVSGLSYPNGLDIDFKKKRMFWCDAHTEKVESADIDGMNRSIVYQSEAKADPFDVAVHNGYVYWTDWALKGLFRIREDGTGGLTKIGVDLFSGLNDIKYFSKADRTAPTNCVVKNGNCSHFCIPTANNNHVCACADDVKGKSVNAEDGRNCPGVAACPVITGVELSCTLRLGSVCEVKCKRNGYHPTVSKITCLTGLIWNVDVNSLCEKDKTCPLLPTPDNVVVDCHGHGRPGEFCTYTCYDNATKVTGDTNRTCNSEYVWTGKPLVCKLKTCHDGISNGKFEYTCNRYIGETCQYNCAGDYERPSKLPLRCQSNQTWSADLTTLCIMKTCPGDIKNGKFGASCKRYIDQPCNYTCNKRYKKTSNNQLKCRTDQTWNADVNSLCELKTCSSNITNGKFDPNCKLLVSTSCTYSCNEGYKKTRDEILECKMDATWDVANVNLLCEELLCHVLDVPKNAQMTPNKCAQPGHIGDDCNFSCLSKADYLNGTQQRKCLKNLTWSGTPIECNLKTCPSDIKNGKFDPSCKLYVGQSCNYSCNDGYKKASNTTIKCKMDATWDATDVGKLCTVSTDGGRSSAATGSPSKNIGVTVGIVIIVLLLIAVAVAALFLVWRRRQEKKRSEYRESSPINNNGTPSYNVGQGNVNLDGSVAFDNPVYGALPGAQPDGATASDVGVEMETTPKQTACTNPLFDVKDKDTTDKKLLLDEDFGSTSTEATA